MRETHKAKLRTTSRMSELGAQLELFCISKNSQRLKFVSQFYIQTNNNKKIFKKTGFGSDSKRCLDAFIFLFILINNPLNIYVYSRNLPFGI